MLKSIWSLSSKLAKQHGNLTDRDICALETFNQALILELNIVRVIEIVMNDELYWINPIELSERGRTKIENFDTALDQRVLKPFLTKNERFTPSFIISK